MITEISDLKKEWQAKGRTVRGIIVHPELVARDFIFSIDYNDNIYLAINSKSLDVEVARLRMYGEKYKDIRPEGICGLPIVREEGEVMKIMSGVFVWLQ